MKNLTPHALDELTKQAHASPRRRAHLTLHPELTDPVQRLAIAMEPDTVVQPHRHPQSFELLHALRGRFVVLYFDDAGAVTRRFVLGGDSLMLETPPNTWHAVLSLDIGGVIFEVKKGPYVPSVGADTAAWGQSAEPARTAALLAWYRQANLGQRF